MRFQIGSTEILREQYCYRCGNLLGRSRSLLYFQPRLRRTPASSVLSIVARVKSAYRELTGYYERSCRACNRDSTREWQRLAPRPPPRIPLGRFASLVTGRPVRRSIDVTESGRRHAMIWARFPVRGLDGKPLGLEVRSVSWEAGRLGSDARSVELLYEADAARPPRSRLLIVQAAGARAIARLRSPERELRAIVEVVREHGARGQRERYADRGNVFHDWNLDRLAAAPRRAVELSVGGAPARVEMAQWSDPQQVVVARMTLNGVELHGGRRRRAACKAAGVAQGPRACPAAVGRRLAAASNLRLA